MPDQTIEGNLYISEKVGIGTAAPQGKLDVRGDIRAGNSDIYFTETNHAHTGIGNTSGYAAIENAANYEALMILGRAGTSKGRSVRLWDYLQVNGGMDVTGGAVLNEVAIGVNPPGKNDFPYPYETIGITRKWENVARNLRLHSPDWIVFHTGNNQGVTGTVAIDPNGSWQSSSREVKEQISLLSSQEALDTLANLNPVKYIHKADQNKKLHIGFIAEDVPGVIASPDQKMISQMDIVAVLTKVVKEQQQTISALAAKVKALEEHHQS